MEEISIKILILCYNYQYHMWRCHSRASWLYCMYRKIEILCKKNTTYNQALNLGHFFNSLTSTYYSLYAKQHIVCICKVWLYHYHGIAMETFHPNLATLYHAK